MLQRQIHHHHLGPVLGELEVEEHAELLQVVAKGESIIAQHRAIALELLHDEVGFTRHGGVVSSGSGAGQSADCRRPPCRPFGVHH